MSRLQPLRVTITGIDENSVAEHITLSNGEASTRVNTEKLSDLYAKYPFVEFGILYSEVLSKEPTQPRYPSFETLKTLEWNQIGHIPLAIHVCGDDVKKLLLNRSDLGRALDQPYRAEFRDPAVPSKIWEILQHANERVGYKDPKKPGGLRVQLNFNAGRILAGVVEYEQYNHVIVAGLVDLATKFRRIEFIIQYNSANAEVVAEINKLKAVNPYILKNLNVLFDFSGGNGISCIEQLTNMYNEQIIMHDPGINVGSISQREHPVIIKEEGIGGIAGGLTPDNIGKAYSLATKFNLYLDTNITWLDLESGVRTNDLLDWNKVELVLAICKQSAELLNEHPFAAL